MGENLSLMDEIREIANEIYCWNFSIGLTGFLFKHRRRGSSNPPMNDITPPDVPADVAENNTFAGLLNDVRAGFGADPVEFDARLGLAAQTHASDMVTQGYTSHVGLNGSTLAERVAATGYAASALGENIGQGQQNQAEILAAWEASPGHHGNNIFPGFEDFGLGTDGTGGNIRWVLVLGTELP